MSPQENMPELQHGPPLACLVARLTIRRSLGAAQHSAVTAWEAGSSDGSSQYFLLRSLSITEIIIS